MQETKSKILLAKPEDHDLLTLSVSKVKTFKDCKAKYYFNYILKLPQKEFEHFIFGKFLHEILENFYKAIMDGSEEKPNVLLSTVWKNVFPAWKSKLSAEQIAEAKQICIKFLKYLSSAPKIEVTAVEKPFYVNIDNRVLLNGFIDRTQTDDRDGLRHVCDYKTTKDKRWLKKDYFQLQTYAFVMMLIDPTLEKIRTSYILLRHEFESLVKEFEKEEVMQIENKFLKIADEIQSEKLFRPSPSKLCQYCGFLESCSAGMRMTGIQDNKFGADSW